MPHPRWPFPAMCGPGGTTGLPGALFQADAVTYNFLYVTEAEEADQ